MNVTELLSKYAVETRFEDLPDEVVHEAKRAVVNLLAVAIGGCNHKSVDIVLEFAGEIGGKPVSSVWGRKEKTDPLFAALVNGISSHVLDFDCNHLEIGMHPSAPVLPAVFALSEQLGSKGKELLLSFVIGFEVECQIGRGVTPSHMYKWHITSTLGHFGSAAAAGKLLKLDAGQMAQALGLAGTQASGFKEMFGTMSKSFHPGKASMNGLLAANLIKKGFTSSKQVIEAEKGFAKNASDEQHFDKMISGLGKKYNLLEISYKPYACGVLAHPIIDGMIRLRDKHAVQAKEVESIHCRTNPLVLNHMGIKDPQTGLESKFSAYHSVAVALIDGTAGEAQYSDDKANDATIRELRNKTIIEVNPEVRRDEAFLEIELAGGQVLQEHVLHALGSNKNPLSDADLSKKFRELTYPLLGERKADRLLDHIWNIDLLEDITEIIEDIRP